MIGTLEKNPVTVKPHTHPLMFRTTRRLFGVRFSHYNAKPGAAPKMTIPRLYEMYAAKQPITCITAHDALSGRMADEAGIDTVLVGDSLAMVAMGLESTSEIELEDMVYHCRAVARGAPRPFLIADLPFGSYEQSVEQACESAIRMVKHGRAEAVKFEGGRELCPIVERLSKFGIATVPHIGLTPQRQISTGGFKVQGKTAASAKELLDDALALEKAGATMILLEGVPDRVATVITERLNVPTIGIGAGSGTSGQVLVQIDMLGGFDAFVPKFLKRYANILETHTSAIAKYHSEVKSGEFPSKQNSYSIKDAEFEKFTEML